MNTSQMMKRPSDHLLKLLAIPPFSYCPKDVKGDRRLLAVVYLSFRHKSREIGGKIGMPRLWGKDGRSDRGILPKLCKAGH